MKLEDALEQLDTLAAVAERTRRYDGFRWAPIAASGGLGWLAGLFQSRWVGSEADSLVDYVRYWVAAAGLSLAIILVEMLWRYSTSPTTRMKRMTLEVMKRLLPSFVAGAGITWVVVSQAGSSGWMLPGLWSILMSLGVFSAAGMLHPSVQWAGVWYLASGVTVLWCSHGEFALHPSAMAIPFGVGQLLTAYLVQSTQIASEAHLPSNPKISGRGSELFDSLPTDEDVQR